MAISFQIQHEPEVIAAVDEPITSLSDLPASATLAALNIRQLAAEGYFQAIAYWLNELLVPQQVYAQVLADHRPGRLKILVESEYSPRPQRLVQMVCSRLYRLESDIIEGIHLIMRPVGSTVATWEKRIRIPTFSQRQGNASQQPEASTSEPTLPPLVPSESVAAADVVLPDETASVIHESAENTLARSVIRGQFQFFRAALLSGAAIAAFFMGGLSDLLLSERLTAAAPSPQLPELAWYDEPTSATEISYTASQRYPGRTVEAALETVAVVPHADVPDPSDPTVTLLFGGELGLNNYMFEDAESLDRLFSDLDIYQQADVAMVGLSEPLATPSTTLQEDFYHRTRPQAVEALRTGGIDIVSLASEGTLTYGSHGLTETLNTLDRTGIYRVGAGRSQQEAHRPEILEVKGQRIAYLGYNPEALKAAKDEKAGVALTRSEERDHILEDIRTIRSQVDWIVVNYRWGDLLESVVDEPGQPEAEPPTSQLTFTQPADWQVDLAHDAIDAGADLVVGYHPRQIQGTEIYRDRAIAYSLGDFVFSQAPYSDHDTAALRVSLRHQQMKVEFLPISIRDSEMTMATGDRGIRILQGIRESSHSFNEPLRFPTVLDARNTRPYQAETPAAAQSAPTGPTTSAEYIEPTTQPIAPLVPPNELIESDAYTQSADGPTRSPHPQLNESDALFSAPPTPELPPLPETDISSPIDEIPADEIPADESPVDESVINESATDEPDSAAQPSHNNLSTDWQSDPALQDWGAKPNAEHQPFAPIPAKPRPDAPLEPAESPIAPSPEIQD